MNKDTQRKFRDQDIVALHHLGWNNADIGRKYQITRERVAQILRREIGTSTPKLFSDRYLKRIIAESAVDIGAGVPLQSVAIRHAISLKTLKAWLRSNGLAADLLAFRVSMAAAIGRNYGEWRLLSIQPQNESSRSLPRCKAVAQCRCGRIHQTGLRALMDGISMRCMKCGIERRKKLIVVHKLSGEVYSSLAEAAKKNGLHYGQAYNMLKKNKTFTVHQEPVHTLSFH